jgi:hypothetical protein
VALGPIQGCLSDARRETRPHPKRLVEVELPIEHTSARAHRGKSIRPGRISTLHIPRPVGCAVG